MLLGYNETKSLNQNEISYVTRYTVQRLILFTARLCWWRKLCVVLHPGASVLSVVQMPVASSSHSGTGQQPCSRSGCVFIEVKVDGYIWSPHMFTLLWSHSLLFLSRVNWLLKLVSILSLVLYLHKPIRIYNIVYLALYSLLKFNLVCITWF